MPMDFDYSHLEPYKRAAYIFCGMNGQNPDEEMGGEHPLLQGVQMTRPAWHFAAEALINLSQMMVSMRQAEQQEAEEKARRTPQ